MTQRRHMTLIAAVATLMASAPLEVIFSSWTWLVQATLVVLLIAGAALGARALRAPTWAQPIATLAAFLVGITWLNSGGHSWGGIIPTADTFRHFGVLMSQAGTDMSSNGIPVDDRPDFLFLAVAGVGICAVLVDLLAVALRRPALAGLPMLAIYAVPVEIDSSNVPFIAFAVGAIGFMWLLVTDNIDRVRMFGRRFTGEGRGVDMWEPSPLAMIGRRIAIAGVALAVIIPFATPGLGSGLIPALGNGAGGSAGGSCHGGCANAQSVNLFATLKGFLNQSSVRPMVTVQTGDPIPGYLRFGVADNLTNDGFGPTTPSGQSISRGLPNPFYDSPRLASNISYEKLHAKVTIDNLALRLLPLYLSPGSGTLTGIPNSWAYDPDTAEVFTDGKPTKNGMTYEFDYSKPTYDAADLRTAPALTPTDPIQTAYAQVPSKVPSVEQIVDQQTAGKTNNYDKVLALYDFFFDKKNHFSYELSTKQGTTGSDIGDFLQQRQGYCVQYASALAWLVRDAGIPARVAFGFTEGTLQPGGTGTYVMTNLNLHAWTEVYFAGFGWVPFDATPSVPGTVRPSWAPDPTQTGPTLPQTAASASAGAGDNPSTKNSAGGRALPSDKNGPGPVGGRNNSDWAWWVLAVLGAILILVLLPAAARIVLRNRRRAADRRFSTEPAEPGEPFVIMEDDPGSGTTRRRAHAAWDEFIDTLVDYGIAVDPAETPRAATERVVTGLVLPDEVVVHLRLIGSSEERARYARRPGASQPLEAGLRAFRKALADLVSTRSRLRAMLLPPSMTQRWAAESSAWLSNTASRAQATWESITRVVSLRRLVTGRGR
jgi:transglutaminase-like putative cysteine protease